MIIDYSAHSTYDNCPAEWFEKYINKRRKRWPKAQRDDALALGSLVHEGLRIWQLHHVVQVPNEVVEEVQPTKECLAAATELVYGYARAYPDEQWPLVHCEEPLQFPLAAELQGLAKIDSYFYVPEYTSLRSGIEGLELTLVPGWYIHEYKTKSSDIPIGLYMQSWEMNLQASYQMLALRYHLSKDQTLVGNPKRDIPLEHEVQGVLVNVLEKPKKYIPKRKCRKCEITYEFYTWIPTGKGSYQCPVCGSVQELQPLKESISDRPASYYRILVSRSPGQLELDKQEMILRGQQMISMQSGGLRSTSWNHKACVDFKWRRSCDYFQNHLAGGLSTLEDNEFETPKDYRGLVPVET